MAAGLLLPEDVGSTDAARVLAFLNTVTDVMTLAATVGFTEGSVVATIVAQAILDRRKMDPFRTLNDVLAVTGVTPFRFTEIVVALSGARPAAQSPARSITIRSGNESPVLGQGISLVVQLLDGVGRGIAGADITCVTTWGTLTARSGTALQRGPSARLVTEPGGIVRVRLDPPTASPLTDLGRAMLDSELSPLGAADGPEERAKALKDFADHYRAEAAEPLREAVDTLFRSFPTDVATSNAGWPVTPVTVIAFAGTSTADVVGFMTIPVRDWLGAFLTALRENITADRRVRDALLNIDLERATGAALGRGIFGVQDAISGLDRGELGRRLAAETASIAVGRYLDDSAKVIGDAALIDATRVAGASGAAIMSGGFAVFETIGSVRQVQDAVGLTADLDGRFGTFDQRLDLLETNKADITTVNALDDRITRTNTLLDQRITTVAASQVTLTDLRALETRIGTIERSFVTTADLSVLASRISGLEASQVTRTDIADVTRRLSLLESTQVTRADLVDLNSRIGRLETGRITRADLDSLEATLSRQITDQVSVARTDLAARLDAKADQSAITVLQRSVSGLQTDTQRLSTRVDNVDTRVTVLGNTRLTRPGS